MLVVWMALAGAADGETWNALRSEDAKATSYLRSNWNRFTENYHPTYVLDEDPATAWVEGVDGNGEGQVLSIPVSTVRGVRAVRVRVRNGYQKSEALLRANAAPRDVRIHLLNPSGTRIATVDDTWEKAMGWQEVVLGATKGDVAAVQIEVVTTHPGTRYADGCISDVLVDVDAATAYDATVEARKQSAMRAWIAGRVEAARYYAALPPEYLFAAASFDRRDVTPAADRLEPTFEAMRSRLGSFEGAYYTPTPVGAGQRVPEELWELFRVAWLLDPTQVAWFEAPDDLLRHERVDLYDQDVDPARERVGLASQWSGEEWRYNTQIAWADAERTQPAALKLRYRRVWSERGTYEEDEEWLVLYDQGRAQAVFVRVRGDEDMDMPYVSETLFTLSRDGAGKIIGVDVSTRRDAVDFDQDLDFDAPRDTLPRVTRWSGAAFAAYR
jgi:hypothetical protein